MTASLLRGAPCSVLAVPRPSPARPAAHEPPPEAEWRTERLTARVEHWPAFLEEFTRRNAGRRAALEVDYADLGAQAQETGYPFLGAAYDRPDRTVELMLGDFALGTRHLTRAVRDVSFISILAGADRRDLVLRLAHGTGQTLLTFES